MKDYVSMGHINDPAHPAPESAAIDALRKIAALETTLRDMLQDRAIHPGSLGMAGLRSAIRIAKEALAPQSRAVNREVIEPLTEPVSIPKAMLAGEEAKVSYAIGGEFAVFLVNMQLTSWSSAPEDEKYVEGYAWGFNKAARWMQNAMLAQGVVEGTISEDVINHCWKMYQLGQCSADHTDKEVFTEVLESFAKWVSDKQPSDNDILEAAAGWLFKSKNASMYNFSPRGLITCVRKILDAQQPENKSQSSLEDAVKLACESRNVEFDSDAPGATLGRLLLWEKENTVQTYDNNAVRAAFEEHMKRFFGSVRPGQTVQHWLREAFNAGVKSISKSSGIEGGEGV